MKASKFLNYNIKNHLLNRLLHNTASEYENLLNTSKAGIIYFDDDLKIIKFSSEIKGILLISDNDIGTYAKNCGRIKKQENFLESLQNVLKTGVETEFKINFSNSLEYFVKMYRYMNEHNRYYIQMIIYNISENTEQLRCEFKNTINNIPIGVFKFSYNGSINILFANDAFYNISECSPDDLENKYFNNYDALINPMDLPDISKAIADAQKEFKPFEISFRPASHSNPKIWLQILANPKLENGEAVFFCVLSNISDKIEAKKALELCELKFNKLISNIDGSIIHVKYDKITKTPNLCYVSDSFLKLIEYERTEYETLKQGNYNFKVTHPEDSMKIKDNIQKKIDGDDSLKTMYRLIKHDGSIIWVQACGSLIAENDEIALYQYVINDITELMTIHTALQKEKEKYEAAASLSVDYLFEYDMRRKKIVSIFGNNESKIDLPIDEFDMNTFVRSTLHPDDLPTYEKYKNDIHLSGKQMLSVEIRVKNNNENNYKWINVDLKIIQEGNVPTLIIGKVCNIDEKKKNELKMLEELKHDKLTGLLNKEETKKQIDEFLKISENKGTFFLADINNFKTINSSYGYLFGDAVLMDIAEVIRSSFKSNFITGRFGGDQFIVFAKNIQEKEKILEYTEKISKVFNSLRAENHTSVQINISIGISICTSTDTTFNELFKKAEIALYYAKHSHENNYMFYTGQKLQAIQSKSDNEYDDETLYQSSATEEFAEISFDVLEGIKDLNSAIHVILANLCRRFSLSYVTLRWFTQDRRAMELNHEWNTNVHTESSDKIYPISIENYYTMKKHFDEDGILNCSNLEDAAQELQFLRAIARSESKALLIAPIYENKALKGTLLLADSKSKREWSTTEIRSVKMVGRIISAHLSSNKIFMDIEHKIEVLVSYDDLTGLYKYDKFIEKIRTFLETNEGNYAVVVSDFANFRSVNDRFGFETGNAFLRKFADMIMHLTGYVLFSSRIYADNFISLIKLESKESLINLVNSSNNNFLEEINKIYPNNNISILSGACIIDNSLSDLNTAIDNANIAKKLVKCRHKSGFLFYEEIMRREISRETEIEMAFKRALKSGEINMFLQPQIDLKTEKIVSAEALTRWIRPDGTFCYPDEFIPIIEKTGLVTMLDFYILEQALILLKHWKEKNIKLIPISVNFSRQHLHNPNFLNQLRELTNKYEIEHKYIAVEITESAFINDQKLLINLLENLYEENFCVSIDDFGTGYSSLNMLTQVKADIIKIDKSFLKNLCSDQTTQRVIEHIILLVKEIGFKLICEGVETVEHKEFLKLAGCDIAQGYLFDKPISIDDFQCKYIK